MVLELMNATELLASSVASILIQPPDIHVLPPEGSPMQLERSLNEMFILEAVFLLFPLSRRV